MMKPIPSLPGYLAGDDGHVYSTRGRWGSVNPRKLDERPTHDGYLRVRVVREYGMPVQHQAVAPVIAEAFLGPKPVGMQVRHLNGDKNDNRPSNLSYGSALANAIDRELHGTTVRGERSVQARHSDVQVAEAVRLVAAGIPRSVVEAKFSVSKSGLQRWVTGAARSGVGKYRLDERTTAA